MARELPLSLKKEQRLALVDGASQHREPIKPQPDSRHCRIDFEDGILKESSQINGCWHVGRTWKPRYPGGTKLWLQEPYQIQTKQVGAHWVLVKYLDDEDFVEVELMAKERELWKARKSPYRRTSGRFMYKSLARHWFEVTGVKAEQVQCISLDDIYAEGILYDNARAGAGHLRWKWKDLWDSIYGGGEFAWDKNPWVFAYNLRKV